MVRVAHLFSFLWCPIMCLYVMSSVLWCSLRFRQKNEVRFVFTSSCLYVLFTWFVFVCGVQHILCCVFDLFFFVLCALCCRFLWIVHFWLLPLQYSLTFNFFQLYYGEFINLLNFDRIKTLLIILHNILLKHEFAHKGIFTDSSLTGTIIPAWT